MFLHSNRTSKYTSSIPFNHDIPSRSTSMKRITIVIPILLAIGISTFLTFSFLNNNDSPLISVKTYIDPLWSNLQSHLTVNSGGLEVRDGVMYVRDLGKVGKMGKHPIDILLETGREKAEVMEEKIKRIRSLEDAVKDYIKAYGMYPPEGFDEWYDLAIKTNSTPAASLFPLAHDSVLPFLALPPSVLRQRAKQVIKENGIFGFEYHPQNENIAERINLVGVDSLTNFKILHHEWADLVRTQIHRLPPSQDGVEPLLLPVWIDDVSNHPPSGILLERSRQLARAGKVWDETELLNLEKIEEDKKGWGNACNPAVSNTEGKLHLGHQRQDRVKSFSAEPMEYADPCLHPEHLVQNGEMIMKEDWKVRGLVPMASLNSACPPMPILWCNHQANKQPVGGGEMIGPTTVGTGEVATFIPWTSKTENRLWWRGNANSAFIYEGWDWKSGQRMRLSRFTSNEQPGELDVMIEQDGELVNEGIDQRELRNRYLDISLVDSNRRWPCGTGYAPEFFCKLSDGSRRPNCPMNFDECQQLLDDFSFASQSSTSAEGNSYKFRLDIDGFGWTTRFRKELSRNNVLIKITLYPEWWSAQAIPWYHFIPARYDFKDLYDIMVYFTGSPEDQELPAKGSVNEKRRKVLEERDKVAEEIAMRGREFALRKMRPEDMRLYMLLLLLEYRRAWSDDRVAATFRLNSSGIKRW